MDTSPLVKPRRRQSAIRLASSSFAASRSLILRCVEGRFALAIASSMIGSSMHWSIPPLLGPETPTSQRSDVPVAGLTSSGLVRSLPRSLQEHMCQLSANDSSYCHLPKSLLVANYMHVCAYLHVFLLKRSISKHRVDIIILLHQALNLTVRPDSTVVDQVLNPSETG